MQVFPRIQFTAPGGGKEKSERVPSKLPLLDQITDHLQVNDKRNVAPNSFPVQSVQGLSQSQTKQNRQIGCKN